MQKEEVLRVNNESLDLEKLFSVMKFTGIIQKMENKLVNGLLVNEKAAELNLTIGDDELQQAVDQERKNRGLYEADDTKKWLKNLSLKIEDLEEYCENQILKEKIKEHLSEGKVEEYFARNSLLFEQAEISQIVVSEKSVAQELFLQASNDEEEFEILARDYTEDNKNISNCGYEGIIFRNTVNSDFTSSIFGANENDIIGPLESDQGFHIIKVHQIIEPELNEETRSLIKNILFNEWVEQEKRRADIKLLI